MGRRASFRLLDLLGVASLLADGEAWLTSPRKSVSNDGMAGQAHNDVITAGREPSGRYGRLGRLVWLLIIAETAALAGMVALALHYRAEGGKVRQGTSAAASRPASSLLPALTSVALRLPADGSITGVAVITAAAEPGAARAQFTVSAVIAGGRPGTVYDLTGNDCSAAAPLPDHVWASGLTGADGTAELAGHSWTGVVTDKYWLALVPSRVSPPPGLRGRFAEGAAAPFPRGQAPCAGPQ